jgi:4-amino-4-deoxy-L-arabinose transferase-like glycosyltransferase
VILLVQDLEVRVINAITGELLRELTNDTTKNYQPQNEQDPNPLPSCCRHVCFVASFTMSVQPNLDRAALPRATGAGSVADACRSAGTVHPFPSAPPGRLTPDWATIRTFSRRHSVMLACLATLSVHLLSLARQLGSDEGGFAVVARHWRDGGPFLYGPQWVDRPPGLIALFDVAQRLGPYGVRLTAALLAVALVAALAWAAAAVGGRPAARWAAWAGFAFGSSVLLGAQQLNGELAAATFVTLSIAALLRAVRVSTTRTQTVLFGVLAGGSATVAVLMKQNFVDAFVFAAVLLAAGVATRTSRLTYRPVTVLSTVLAFIVGAVVPGAAALGWAEGHGGTGALGYAMFGFRTDASAVMASWSWAAPLHRLEVLGQLALLSGLLFLLVHLAVSRRRRLRRLDPLPWAIAATAGVEVFGVFAGENFWPHYLIALIPMVALAAGLSVNRRAPGRRWTRRLVAVSAIITAIASPVAAVSGAYSSSQPYTIGRWVAASAQPGDTIVVPFTHANVIDAAGLKPGYPYSWSLPTRTLDPDLSLLTSILNGPAAPTWVVRWDGPHTWGLDPNNHVDAALHGHYRVAGEVCGHTVWLHDGMTRSLATVPSTSACGARGL